jgi:hypothetical protein
MIYGAIFLIGLVFMWPALLFAPVGLIEIPISYFRRKNKSSYRIVANILWLLSTIYLAALYFWMINLPGGSFSGFFLPPLLIIPGVLNSMYAYYLFRSI